MPSPDVVINGTLTNAAANPIAGTVVWTLVNAGASVVTANSGATIVQPQVSVAAAADGTWTVTLWRNSLLSPETTYYQVELIPAGSNIASGAAAYALNTAGTFAFSSLSPQVVSAGQPYISIAGTPGATGATGANGAQGNPGTTNLPYFDAQTYGCTPKAIFPSSTTGTIAGGSLGTLTLAAAADFVMGSGIVVDQAGPAPTGTAFSAQAAAPTVSVPANAGSGTVNYCFIPADGKGGLGPCSLTAQITNAPAHFGAPSFVITSANQSGNTLTVTVTGNMGGTQLVDYALISYFTGADAAFNGRYLIQTITNGASTVFTVTLLTSATLTGIITTAQTARLVTDVYNVVAASRTSDGKITVTTDIAHGIQITASPNPTIGILSGALTVGPDTHILEGQYRVIAGTSGSTVVLQSALNTTDTQINGTSPNALLTVWNYVKLAMPATSGTGAVKYWVYADYTNSGTFALIGSTLPNQTEFLDFGPWFRAATTSTSAFVAQSYVPTSLTGTGSPPQPSTSVQNQLYNGQITGITGTTATISPNASNSVSGLKVKHDDGYWLAQAITAAATAGGGTLYLSPGASTSAKAYHINYPLTIPSTVGVQQNAAVIANETITMSTSAWQVASGPQAALSPQFTNRNYAQISGIANPLINNTNGGDYTGLCFTDGGFQGSSGQTFVFSNAFYIKFHQCTFQAASPSSIPITFAGIGGANCRIEDCDFSATGIMPNTYNQGQPPYHPHLLPAIWMKGTDQTNGTAMSNFAMDGMNSFAGRGILLDLSGNYTGPSTDYKIEVHENQAPVQPMFMVLGGNFGAAEVYLKHVIMDSSTIALVANWSIASFNWTADTITMAGAGDPIVTGDAVSGMRLLNTPYRVGQSANYIYEGTGSVNYVYAFNPPGVPIEVRAYPTSLQGTGAVYGQVPQVSGVGLSTATTGGSIVPGTYTITVSAEMWNGGEGAFSVPVTITVPAGTSTNTITATWNAQSGIKGFYPYIGNQKKNGSAQLGTSVTFTTSTPGGGNMPVSQQFDGGGLPMLDNVTQSVIATTHSVTQSTFKSDIAASSLTAARTVNVPDASGTMLVGANAAVGNGSSSNLTALAKGTGSGPTSDVAVGWTQLIINGTTYWIPLFQ